MTDPPAPEAPERIYRLYFNHKEEFPLVWTIDEGTVETERKVAAVYLDGCFARTRYDATLTPGNLQPHAWLEVTACSLDIVSHVALFVKGKHDPENQV